MLQNEAIETIKTVYNTVRKQSAVQVLKKNKDLLKFLDDKYPLLLNHSLCEKFYWLLNNLDDFPYCQYCKKVKLDGHFQGIDKGYSKYCCKKCAALSNDTQDKIKKTCLERLGVENASKSDVCKQKFKRTMLQRYGVEFAAQSQYFLDKSKEVYLNHLGVDHPMKSILVKNKSKNTCLNKYGVSSVLLLDSVKQKSKQTCLERYGTECPQKSKIVKDKINQSIVSHYGSLENYRNYIFEKSRQTCLERYGVEYAIQTEAVKQKYFNTIKERFSSNSTFENDIIKSKCIETIKQRYGVDNVFKSNEIKDKIKKTNLQRYGNESSSRNPDIIKKIRETSNTEDSKKKRINTNRLKFGYDYPQCDPNYEFRFTKYYYDNTWFDSSWEVLFYDFLNSNDIWYYYHPRVRFSYIYNNVTHYYRPDFYLPKYKIFIELKGDHFFDTYGNLINPFDRSQDALYKEKQKCMIKHNVKILRENDLWDIGIDLTMVNFVIEKYSRM